MGSEPSRQLQLQPVTFNTCLQEPPMGSEPSRQLPCPASPIRLGHPAIQSAAACDIQNLYHQHTLRSLCLVNVFSPLAALSRIS